MARPNACYLPVTILLFLLLGCKCRSDRSAAGDGEKLLAAKRDWGSPRQLASWDPAAAADHCSWKGVVCADGVSVVTELSLRSLNLTGSVPASVCELENLDRLDLSYNILIGVGFKLVVCVFVLCASSLCV
jgi:kinase